MVRRRARRTATAAAVLLLLLLGVGGCGRDSSSSASSRGGEAPAAAPAAPAPGGVADQAGGSADQAGGSAAEGVAAVPGAAGTQRAGSATGAAAAVPGVQLVRTVDVVIEVDQLATSAARVRAVAQSAGGTVSSEVTTFPESPTDTVQRPEGTTSGDTAAQEAAKAGTRTAQPGESVLVLRVPVAALDQTVDRVVAVGTVLSRTASSLDVTADLADLGSRVKTQQASVERVRQLLAKASSLQDIVLLESELSRRQADLEALQARLASVSDRAALSTLTVTLRTPQVQAEEDEDSGFLAGLKQGWQAVITSTTVLLTLVGALLPVVVLAALVGLPVWLVVRRRRRRSPATAAAPSGPVPSGPVPSAPPTTTGTPPTAP